MAGSGRSEPCLITNFFTKPQATQLLYAGLSQQCAIAMPNQRGIFFVSNTHGGQRHWYLELIVGSTKRQFSL